MAVIHDFSRTMGAEGFQLYVRGRGSSLEGIPDSMMPPPGEAGRSDVNVDEALD